MLKEFDLDSEFGPCIGMLKFCVIFKNLNHFSAGLVILIYRTGHFFFSLILADILPLLN